MEKKVAIGLGMVLIVLLGIYAGLAFSLHGVSAENTQPCQLHAVADGDGRIRVVMSSPDIAAYGMFVPDDDELRGTVDVFTAGKAERKYYVSASPDGSYILEGKTKQADHSACNSNFIKYGKLENISENSMTNHLVMSLGIMEECAKAHCSFSGKGGMPL